MNRAQFMKQLEKLLSDISEEERKNDDKHKKNDNNKKGVGFVERNNSKDYNIVYRNKQTKPMTVSELFGIKSKEEKKAEEKPKTNPVVTEKMEKLKKKL